MTELAYRLSKKPRVGSSAYREYLQIRRCGDKVPYTAEWVARNAATALGWISPSYADLEAYACEFCDHFHLGHPYYRTMPTHTPTGTRRALEKLMKKDDE